MSLGKTITEVIALEARNQSRTRAKVRRREQAKAKSTSEPTEEQITAAYHHVGHAVVQAPAGAGKSTVAENHALYIHKALGVPLDQHLIFTHTTGAAAEILARVELRLGCELPDNPSGTLHAFANGILRDHGHLIKMPNPRLLATAEAQARVIREVVTGLGAVSDPVRRHPERILQVIGYAQAACLGGDLGSAIVERWNRKMLSHEDEIREIAAQYEARKRQHTLIDFNDQITLATKILREYPAVARDIRAQYHYVTVDETHDLSAAQLELLLEVVGPATCSMFILDEAQVIFSWAGAREHPAEYLRAKLGAIKEYVLAQNFRCSPQVLAVANGIVRQLPGRYPDLWTRNTDGPRARMFSCADDREATAVVAEVVREHQATGSGLDDFLIQTYMHIHGDLVGQALKRCGIPWSRDRYRKDAVWVDSIHQAKGDQRRHVIIFNLVEGVLPGDLATPLQNREAVRLCYVAATRARQTLDIVNPGLGAVRQPSGSRRTGSVRATPALAALPSGTLPLIDGTVLARRNLAA
jgi:DNA helicase II / ATP-dependent DNA helicase PcrA